MVSEIITVGDELLIGQVLNTNQAYVAEKLNSIGIDVGQMTTVGDSFTSILRSFQEALDRADVVIVTGGLGPTHDDITKKAVCKFFDSELAPHPEIRVRIEEIMQTRNITWTQAAEEQTMFPKNATVIKNPIGTAAGMLFSQGKKRFIVLPGVPYEMEAMMDQSVVPLLAPLVHGSVIRHHTLRSSGVPESILAQKIGPLEEILDGATLAFLPSAAGVRMRITVHAGDEESASQKIQHVQERLLGKVGRYVYGTGADELEQVVGHLLTDRHLTISIAESCTGGALADRITNVSGSSAYFERGVVVYSNKSKTEILGVPVELIQKRGAVSKEVAQAMASGIRSAAGTDIGVSTTGITGPTGGSPEKPVGLVWIGYADKAGSLAIKFHFGQFRLNTKNRATQAALELVRRKLLRIE